MHAVTCYSPAKLNLFLELHRRREDGFHDLETVMLAISRCDRVQVRRRSDSRLCVTAEWSPSRDVWQRRLAGCEAASLEIPSGPGNLAYRAAERMCQAFRINQGFDIHINKTIPAGAGMGGASSNAASVLRSVASLGGIPLDHPQLWTLAGELGSDVPFFLGLPGRNVAALATGRGEQLRSTGLRGSHVFVVAFPPQSLSTARVYAACQVPQGPVGSAALTAAMAAGDSRSMADSFFNRLAEPARQLSPWIDRLLAAMRRMELNGCQLTGSGSACFALARSKRHAVRSIAGLAARGFQLSFMATPLPLPTPLQYRLSKV